MAVILEVNGQTPVLGENCFVAPNATIVGDVVMGNDCSVWFNAVIRGDVNSIRIGNKVNIQDGAVLHCTYQKTTVNLGNNVSIGHNAIVHGCKVADNVLIGMGAIVMDNCDIGSNTIIAAGAVVTEAADGWEAYRQVGATEPAVVLADLSVAELRGQLLSRYADAVQRLPAEQRITLSNQSLGNF